MTVPLDQARVLETLDAMPAFPQVILDVIHTLDDPDASLGLLTRHVEQDSVVAGHLLSMANRAGHRVHGGRAVGDVFTAISLVGLSRVREVTVMLSMASFMEGCVPAPVLRSLWAHSLAVANCSVELARYVSVDVRLDAALLVGLMHDVGALWLHRFEPRRMALAMTYAERQDVDIDAAERNEIGVDHGEVGAWLASAWGLPGGIVTGIAHHHEPDSHLHEPLVAIAHVSEVLAVALELAGPSDGRVRRISAAACSRLELDWGPDAQRLFGKIEARSRHAVASLRH